jgi:hypothetical protein
MDSNEQTAPRRCECLLQLAMLLIAAGCTREMEQPPPIDGRTSSSAGVDFSAERKAPISRKDYVVRSREVGRPFSPESIHEGAYIPRKFEPAELSRGPEKPLELDLKANEVAPAEDQGAAYFDAHSRQVAWPAYTCLNAKCNGAGKDGRPYLFVRQISGIKVTAGGQMELSPQADQQVLAPVVCPSCGSSEWTGAYEPPEVAARRELLEAELAASRAARQQAKDSGVALPVDAHRAPMAIMRDLAQLPKLYLLPPE